MRTTVQFETEQDLYALVEEFSQKNGLMIDPVSASASKKIYLKKTGFFSGGLCMSVEKTERRGILEFWLPEQPAWLFSMYPLGVFAGLFLTGQTLLVSLGAALGAGALAYGYLKPALAKSPGIHSDGWVAKMPKSKIRAVVNPFLQKIGAPPIA
jgi:hypothetical protein